MSFVHLHAHTEYSMLDGFSRIADMFSTAADAGMPACAITDHGVMYGALDFYKSGTATGVKPILGMEGYLFDGNRKADRPSQKQAGQRLSHLTLLASNDTGYRNLMKVSSKSWLEGFHYFPRSDHELLAEYSEGLICLSGCLSAEIPKLIVAGDIAGAKRKISWYRDVFGDRFYLELQDHGIDVQKPLNDTLVSLGKEMGIDWVATNDSHYTHKEDAPAHEVLLCINTGSELSDPNRFKFDSDHFYLKTPEEMAEAFKAWPGACENTLEVAERCNVSIDFGNLLLPRYEVPQNHSLDSYLRELVFEGLKKRYGALEGEIVERANYELKVIADMGFAGYFLVVQDFVNWAKGQGIRVGPGRGSAAGSIVSYAVGITELDPVRYDLMFERFLNPERIAMPDIDIDFDERTRGDVIRYVQDKYGEDHVGQIVTYGTIKGKQAIKDAARVLGFPYQEGDRLTKMYPSLIMGRDSGLTSALETSPELAEAYKSGGASKEIIDTALKIENVKRSAGIHAAGVVIGRDPLEEHVPLKRGDHDEVVTQFDMKGVESLGLLKMDFLGLRNLTVIDLTLDNIFANTGEKVDIDVPSFDDPAVYEMLSRGDTDGVFQLESDGMRRYLTQLKPTKFEHIMAMNALYRPGPMDQIPTYIERMNDPSKIEYLHPKLEDVTKETFGVLVFQEQIVQTLQKIADYSPGEADLVRKAIGKKNRELMASEKPKFIKGCVDGGVSEQQANHLWGLIERFADYSFNRAHAACYAYIAYQTAWLKAHHPVEFMAALLTSVKDRKDDKPKYLHMARKMGIPVLIPDVNSSELDFTPVGDSVRFGLSAVRGLGSSVAEKIIDARKSKGDFKSFHDFCRNVDRVCLNKKTLESLILAGAFESLGHTRKGLIDVYESLASSIAVQRVNEEQGIMSLFGGVDEAGEHTDDPIPIDEFPRDVLRNFEKTALGLFVSDHPLLGVEGLLSRMTDTSIAGLVSRRVGENVTIGGMISSVRKRITRNGSVMVTLTVEDVAGAVVDVLVFAKTYEQYGSLIQEDEILLISGRIDRDVRNDSVQLLASKLHKPDLGEETPLVINLMSDTCTPRVVDGLKAVLVEHPGSTQVYLKLAKGRSTTMLKLASEFWVDTDNGLHAELKALLGPTCLT